ncbi:tRNA pseudouridine(55) synthase TruB [Zavarzinella formosa]|uniref:tRNA pseudouridine(55) synthase TruB n=1 Tax=Zavarzinella formosa TaxID=360055 RepID=UPI000301892A|nr:tRNA pseudouridine(55) synthase TruB [Zavarzinella formosa]
MQTSGFLVVNKTQGITSRDVVNRAMNWFPKRTRLGHGGTLDPLATGVLVLAFGQATRLLEYVQRSPKTYTTKIIFGATSDSDDADGVITPREGVSPVDESAIRTAMNGMIGDISQIPPAFSALKVEGQRAYALARKGAEVDLEPRTIRIDHIELLEYTWPTLRLKIDCGKGTYIRSIARDLGNTLGVGGYVGELLRDRIGGFALDKSVSPEATREEALRVLWPMTAPLRGLPRCNISAEEIRNIRFGRTINLKHADAEEFVVLDENGELIAIGKLTNGKFQPTKVIPSEG